MRTITKITIAAVVSWLLVAAVACETAISGGEIDQMCQKRLSLEGDRPGTPEERLDKCKEDARAEGAVKRIYECRMKATDLDTFWNKCR